MGTHEWRVIKTGTYRGDNDLYLSDRGLVAWVRPHDGQYLLLSSHIEDDVCFPTLEAAKLAAELIYA